MGYRRRNARSATDDDGTYPEGAGCSASEGRLRIRGPAIGLTSVPEADAVIGVVGGRWT